MTPIFIRATALVGAFLCAACEYPHEVKVLSAHTSARTLDIQSNTKEQQATLKAARKAAVRQATTIRDTAAAQRISLAEAEQDLRDAAFAPHTTAARNLHLLAAYRAEDEALYADAFALLSSTEYKPEFSRAAKLDISGVAKAQKMLIRLRDGKQMSAADIISYMVAVNEELEALEKKRQSITETE